MTRNHIYLHKPEDVEDAPDHAVAQCRDVARQILQCQTERKQPRILDFHASESPQQLVVRTRHSVTHRDGSPLPPSINVTAARHASYDSNSAVFLRR